jgi:CRISPR-associated protein Cmr6
MEKSNFLKNVFKSECTKEEFEDIFVNRKVIFLDAFIVDSFNKDKLIFGDDYITKHYDEKDENWIFKEPNPVKFLKILPDVVFEFQFIFKNKKYEKYLKLFENILKEIGVGAKTNVGYGRFLDVK